jgi:hypothetical protein
MSFSFVRIELVSKDFRSEVSERMQLQSFACFLFQATTIAAICAWHQHVVSINIVIDRAGILLKRFFTSSLFSSSPRTVRFMKNRMNYLIANANEARAERAQKKTNKVEQPETSTHTTQHTPNKTSFLSTHHVFSFLPPSTRCPEHHSLAADIVQKSNL